MRKKRNILAALLVGASFLSLCSCNQKEVNTLYEIDSYKGNQYEKDEKTPYYNKNIFYSNSVHQGYPDAFVLDDIARSGYYYLYGTAGSFTTMRSTDLVNWENAGPTFFRDSDDVTKKLTDKNQWAPEVVYDEETELYYMYFSATPEVDSNFNNDNGIIGIGDKRSYLMYVATSKSPTGPFKIVNFKERDRDNLNKEVHELSKEEVDSGEYAYIIKEEEGTTKYYEAQFPQYYSSYSFFKLDEFCKLVQKNKDEGGKEIILDKIPGTLDPHPYVDPQTKKKYFIFKIEGVIGGNVIAGVEMEDWLTPKWETAKYLIASNYYTMDDFRAGTNKNVTYETTDVNEGPFMIYRDGKYFLTYSVNNFGDSSYQVGMGYSNSILGDYRKLTEEEGGLLLSSNNLESDTISGAGHHSFIERDGKTYILYHRHADYQLGGNERYTATDEVKFITIEDKDGNELTIPYVNGPTDSVQPIPEFASNYKNVASMATITANSNCDTNALNDGLLSVSKIGNEDFKMYIPETIVDKTTTFNMKFENALDVNAVMVYNSSYEDTAFTKVARIELVLEDGTKKVINDIEADLINDVIVKKDGNTQYIRYVKSGSAIYCEFNSHKVKEINITVEKPEYQENIGISEIKILGKKGA